MKNIKIENLESIQKAILELDRGMQERLIQRVTTDAYKNIINRAKVNYKTGNMENNITYRVRKKSLSGMVFLEDKNMMVKVSNGTSLNYALFVLYGTKPHTIEPKDKKSLRFTSVDGFVHSKLLKHKGYAGNNFLKDGLEDTFKNLDKIFKDL